MPFIVPSQLLTSYKFCFTERAAKSIIIDFCFIIHSLRMVYNLLLYLKFPLDDTFFHWDFARARSTIGFVREFWQMRINLHITNKQLNLQSWNLDSLQQLLKASSVPILGILRYVIVNWDKKKHKKTVIFGLKSY